MRKIFILFFGWLFLVLGVALIVLPGPAFIFIPLGVAILSLEYAWAKRLLQWMKARLNSVTKSRGA